MFAEYLSKKPWVLMRGQIKNSVGIHVSACVYLLFDFLID